MCHASPAQLRHHIVLWYSWVGYFYLLQWAGLRTVCFRIFILTFQMVFRNSCHCFFGEESVIGNQHRCWVADVISSWEANPLERDFSLIYVEDAAKLICYKHAKWRMPETAQQWSMFVLPFSPKLKSLPEEEQQRVLGEEKMLGMNKKGATSPASKKSSPDASKVSETDPFRGEGCEKDALWIWVSLVLFPFKLLGVSDFQTSLKTSFKMAARFVLAILIKAAKKQKQKSKGQISPLYKISRIVSRLKECLVD